MKSIITYFLYLALLALIMAVLYNVWAATPALVAEQIKVHKIANPGIYGDQYGAFNALFTSFAFAAFIVTLLMQMHELKLQRDEIRDNRIEFTTQAWALSGEVEISALAARITALPLLIENAESMLAGLNETGFGKGAITRMDIPRLERIISVFSEYMCHNDKVLDIAGKNDTLNETVLGPLTFVYHYNGNTTGSLSMSKENLIEMLTSTKYRLNQQIQNLIKLKDLRTTLQFCYEQLNSIESVFRNTREEIFKRVPPSSHKK